MKNSLLRSCALFLLAGAAAFAADIDGKWITEAQGKGGPQTITLKADGSKLTGTVEGGRGGAVEIKDGTVKDKDIAFTIVREFNGNSMKLSYKGTLSGDDLNLTVSRDGGEGRAVTAKRSH